MNNQSSNKLEHWLRFLEFKFNHTETHRNHYETMANVGVSVQTALTAGILTWHIPCPLSGPSKWLQSCVVALAFFFIWLLINVFVRLQLRNRRLEALHYNALDSALRKWANEPPKSEDLIPYPHPPDKYHVSRWQVICDLLYPNRKVVMTEEIKGPPFTDRRPVMSDDIKGDYPTELVKKWEENEHTWVKPILHNEWLYWWGSVIILSLGQVWILLKCIYG